MSAPAIETTNPVAATPPAWRQMLAMVRMELVLLRRNMTAAVLSVVIPLVLGVVMMSGNTSAEDGVAKATGVFGLIVVFAVHHHLTTVYASRRQEMVLRRLHAGVPSGRTILIGAASSTVLVFLAVVVVLVGYGVIAAGLPVPANPVTMLVALVLGSAVLAGLSAALSGITHSTEAAMLTTLPTMAIFLMSPGVLLPLGSYPDSIESAASWLPMGPIMEMVRTGWLGHDVGEPELSFVGGIVDVLPALGVLVMWLLIAASLTKRYFRWEPRHS